MTLSLVLGGTRSGKSEVAERMAAATGRRVAYLACADPSDPEMAERIALHRARRPESWTTIEGADPFAVCTQPDLTLLIDGIAAWIARLMTQEGLWTEAGVQELGPGGIAAKERILQRVRDFSAAVRSMPGDVIVVAEESGLGLIPQGASSRRFLDLSGEVVQTLAAGADRVVFVVAGQTIELKGPPLRQVPEQLAVHGDALVSPGFLDFAVNVSPWGPPEWLHRRIQEALRSVNEYPDESRAVRALAERHGREPAEVLPLNGAAEAFWLLARALAPKRAVCVHPQFTAAEAALVGNGHLVERVFRDPADFSFDPGAVPRDADLVFICNPNNPTGTLDPAAVLERLVSPGRVLVIDESFMEFTSGEEQSLTSAAGLGDVVVIRSITKLWGIPGLRAGYLVAPSRLVAVLRRGRQPWPVNALSLAALEATARPSQTASEIAGKTTQARDLLIDSLRALPGVRVWSSHTNFVLICVPNGSSLRDRLARRGIAVRPACTFPGLSSDHLRIAVRRPEENAVLLRALGEELG
jgi:histidinol-phosphate/aromatic aminotransferase/cobyric acid decarboxylase-like protein